MNAATLRVLIEKGLSPDDILAVAEAMEAKPDRTNADRQARFRARKRNAVTVTDNPPNDIYSNPPVSSDEETRAIPKKPKSVTPAKPDDVSEPVWTAFVALRRKKGGLSDLALAGIRAEAVKAGWTMEAALAKCVQRNWQGFEADWVAKQTGPPSNDQGGYLDHYLAKQARKASG